MTELCAVLKSHNDEYDISCCCQRSNWIPCDFILRPSSRWGVPNKILWDKKTTMNKYLQKPNIQKDWFLSKFTSLHPALNKSCSYRSFSLSTSLNMSRRRSALVRILFLSAINKVFTSNAIWRSWIIHTVASYHEVPNTRNSNWKLAKSIGQVFVPLCHV